MPFSIAPVSPRQGTQPEISGTRGEKDHRERGRSPEIFLAAGLCTGRAPG